MLGKKGQVPGDITEAHRCGVSTLAATGTLRAVALSLCRETAK